jgi:hypothetical protein
MSNERQPEVSIRQPDLKGGHEWVTFEWPAWSKVGVRELRNEFELGEDSPAWDMPNGVCAYLDENGYWGEDRWLMDTVPAWKMVVAA